MEASEAFDAMSVPLAAEVCPSCGEFVRKLDSQTGWCSDCTGDAQEVSNFLSVNADHIEHYILQGFTLKQAIKRVYVERRPICAVCSKPMPRTKSTAVICRRTKECRRVSRRYVYLYREKGLSKAEALAAALNNEGG